MLYLLMMFTILSCTVAVPNPKSLAKREDGAVKLVLTKASQVFTTTDTPDMTAISVCAWTMAETGNTGGTLFSYAKFGTPHEFVLLSVNSHLKLIINGINGPDTTVTVADGQLHHVCATWNSADGSWQIFLDNVLEASGDGFRVGSTISAGGKGAIGLEQDCLGGCPAKYQAYIGEIAFLNVYKHVLTEEEIADISKHCGAQGDVFAWDIGNLDWNDDVEVVSIGVNDMCDDEGGDKGDPHLKTFDGRPFSFQGICWYTMVKDCTSEKPDFEITAKFQLREDSTSEHVKSNTAAINVTVGDEYAIVDGLNVITGNGEGLESKSKKLDIEEDGKSVLLVFTVKDTTFKLKWTLKGRDFNVAFYGSAYHGKLCGLLGNADGDSRNDFQNPDGTILQDPVEFGESWKVQGLKCD